MFDRDVQFTSLSFNNRMKSWNMQVCIAFALHLLRVMGRYRVMTMVIHDGMLVS